MVSNACAMKKSSKKNPKARLPPKRGQVKVGIFRRAWNKAADIASVAWLRRKRRSCAADKPASATPLKISALLTVLGKLVRRRETM